MEYSDLCKIKDDKKSLLKQAGVSVERWWQYDGNTQCFF